MDFLVSFRLYVRLTINNTYDNNNEGKYLICWKKVPESEVSSRQRHDCVVALEY